MNAPSPPQTGRKSKTCLRESCPYIRRERLEDHHPRRWCRRTNLLGLVQSGLGCSSCGQAPVVAGVIDALRGTEAASFQLTSHRSLDSSCFAQTPEERPFRGAPGASNGGIDEHICCTQEDHHMRMHHKTLRMGPLLSEAQGLGLSTIIVCSIWLVSLCYMPILYSMVNPLHLRHGFPVGIWVVVQCHLKLSHSCEAWQRRGRL